MQGLFDWLKTPEGQGLLSGVASYAANARRGAPINSIGTGLLGGVMGYGGALDRQERTAENAQQRQLRDMQMKAAQFGLQKTERDMATEEAIRRAAQGAYAPAMPGLGGLNSSLPAEMQTPMVPGKPAAFNTDQFLGQVMSIDPVRGMEWQAKFKKEPKYTVVDGNLVRTDTDKPTVAFTAPQKPEATPSAIREYQFAANQGYKGSFQQWVIDQKKAGASQVNVNNDNLGLKPKDRFEMEGKLSDDFMKATALDRGVLNATSKIAAAFTESGAMKDQAAIYSFAKMLDPEGAVREADYAAIANTAGLVDRVRNYANKLLTGEQLNPTQRAEMMSLAKSFEKVANSRIGPQRSRFGNQAQRYNLSPDAVLSPDGAATGWSITPVR